MKKFIKNPFFLIVSLLSSVVAVSIFIASFSSKGDPTFICFLTALISGMLAYKSFKYITISPNNKNYYNSLTREEKLELIEKDLDYIKDLSYYVAGEVPFAKSLDILKEKLAEYNKQVKVERNLIIVTTDFHEASINLSNLSDISYTQIKQI